MFHLLPTFQATAVALAAARKGRRRQKSEHMDTDVECFWTQKNIRNNLLYLIAPLCWELNWFVATLVFESRQGIVIIVLFFPVEFVGLSNFTQFVLAV